MIDDARRILDESARVVVVSGAGMSAESGVPTFRDALTGLWEHYDPADLATPEAWSRDPEFVWQWYQMRRRMLRDAEPNAGHLAVGAARKVTAVVTQNVDDLHERAGSDPVHHVHGELSADRCDTCGAEPDTPVDDGDDTPPRCSRCEGHLRPAVVWFGEMLPRLPWEAAVRAVTDTDAVIVVGTSGLVYPAASLPETGADAGARVIEVNPDDSGFGSVVDVNVRATAADALPELLP